MNGLLLLEKNFAAKVMVAYLLTHTLAKLFSQVTFMSDLLPLPSAPDLGPVNYVVAADEAFPMKPFHIRPHPGRHRQQNLQVLNCRLASAHRMVEKALGHSHPSPGGGWTTEDCRSTLKLLTVL